MAAVSGILIGSIWMGLNALSHVAEVAPVVGMAVAKNMGNAAQAIPYMSFGAHVALDNGYTLINPHHLSAPKPTTILQLSPELILIQLKQHLQDRSNMRAMLQREHEDRVRIKPNAVNNNKGVDYETLIKYEDVELKELEALIQSMETNNNDITGNEAAIEHFGAQMENGMRYKPVLLKPGVKSSSSRVHTQNIVAHGIYNIAKTNRLHQQAAAFGNDAGIIAIQRKIHALMMNTGGSAGQLHDRIFHLDKRYHDDHISDKVQHSNQELILLEHDVNALHELNQQLEARVNVLQNQAQQTQRMTQQAPASNNTHSQQSGMRVQANPTHNAKAQNSMQGNMITQAAQRSGDLVRDLHVSGSGVTGTTQMTADVYKDKVESLHIASTATGTQARNDAKAAIATAINELGIAQPLSLHLENGNGAGELLMETYKACIVNGIAFVRPKPGSLEEHCFKQATSPEQNHGKSLTEMYRLDDDAKAKGIIKAQANPIASPQRVAVLKNDYQITVTPPNPQVLQQHIENLKQKPTPPVIVSLGK